MNGQAGRRVSVKRVVANVIRNMDISDASRNLIVLQNGLLKQKEKQVAIKHL